MKGHSMRIAVAALCMSFVAPLRADDFTDNLQFLAVCVACLGQYSADKPYDGNMNGVHVKARYHKYNITPHLDINGTSAENHAWLWVQRNDGVWY